MSSKMHILTFDIQDGFQGPDNPSTADIAHWINCLSRTELGDRRLLDLCDQDSVKATFFIFGWVAETARDNLVKIASRGDEVACHSYFQQLVILQTPEVFKAVHTLEIDRIEGAVGRRSTSYRAPGFSTTNGSAWAFEISARNDIEVDASVVPTEHGYILSPANRLDYSCRL